MIMKTLGRFVLGFAFVVVPSFAFAGGGGPGEISFGAFVAGLFLFVILAVGISLLATAGGRRPKGGQR
ncbi:MAG: hypothetical protein A2669_02965 [Candidatus Yanofskybacteria bacterium RIFCSPHIGHO2_01_FULL_48_25b]|uniref:Uncharacterized protein n=1 Tax=Candidatus Yanofskybacteria bacterium RIFCSPHIGHO2_01_FULL_48_25b TaxID=1802672 RepID=A0A1F8F2R9_9BACT|nr:MAG: hypothetical protein A2669_02965 [Candidatus Yanofskybacteria bacterium RIFCSPHIGHO2_01_FULL_48_25b]